MDFQVGKLSTVYEYVVRDDREVFKSFLAPSSTSSYCYCSFTLSLSLAELYRYYIWAHLIDDPVNNGYGHKSHLVCICSVVLCVLY